MKLPDFRLYSIALRIAAASAVAGFLLFLIGRAFLPVSSLAITTDLVRLAPYVSAPLPPERLAPVVADAEVGRLVPLAGSPVYLDLAAPTDFDRVAVEVRFTNLGNALLEIGALASNIDDQYDLRPADAPLLDSLSWNRLASGRLAVLEKDQRYVSVDAFFSSPPPVEQVAAYRTSAQLPLRIAGYEPRSEVRSFETSLRGRHRLYTYIKNEPLNFTFQIQDMNRQAGADPVLISVYRPGESEPLARAILDDDGDTTDDQRSIGLRSVAVSLTDPEESVYQIEVTAPADIFIRKILTPQRKVVFASRLYLGDHVGYSDRTAPLTVLTDGLSLTAKTSHAEGLQELAVGGAALAVAEPNAVYARRLHSAGLATVVSPKRDILLETEGVFAFSAADYFTPFPLVIGWDTTAADLETRGIRYVLTEYETPRLEGSLKVARAEFAAASLASEPGGDHRFVLSAPGVAAANQELRIASVRFILSRDAGGGRGWWSRLVRLFEPGRGSAPLVLPQGDSFEETVEK
ncbi:MAG: hypothetical protein WCT10_04985 [Patescibacteria group bacterium]|jgi:hypothetical protein